MFNDFYSSDVFFYPYSYVKNIQQAKHMNMMTRKWFVNVRCYSEF